jgi:hypothetical protein
MRTDICPHSTVACSTHDVHALITTFYYYYYYWYYFHSGGASSSNSSSTNRSVSIFFMTLSAPQDYIPVGLLSGRAEENK